MEGDLGGRVYEELRQLAAGQLRAERPGQTLQSTALVNEALPRLETLRPQPGPPRSACLVSSGQRLSIDTPSGRFSCGSQTVGG
jgi:hypothetical protein